jgi:hypothetical protein
MSTTAPDEHVYYAHKVTRPDGCARYCNASPSRWWVTTFGSPDPIVAVRLRERTESDPPSSHYAWIDAKRPDRYAMLFPSEIQFETCFEYGSKAEEARGYGRKVNLIVEEIVS